jgi:hypothetical protein
MQTSEVITADMVNREMESRGLLPIDVAQYRAAMREIGREIGEREKE